jgi:hypothetical protein
LVVVRQSWKDKLDKKEKEEDKVGTELYGWILLERRTRTLNLTNLFRNDM